MTVTKTDTMRPRDRGSAFWDVQPQLREWRGVAVLIYRTFAGWEYKFIHHQGGAPKTYCGSTMEGGELPNIYVSL